MVCSDISSQMDRVLCILPETCQPAGEKVVPYDAPAFLLPEWGQTTFVRPTGVGAVDYAQAPLLD